MSIKNGLVKVRLLTGVTLRVHHPGPLPSILLLEADADSDRGARVPCRRVDVDRYEQLTVEEMIAEGLIKPVHWNDDAKAATGVEAKPEDTQEP